MVVIKVNSQQEFHSVVTVQTVAFWWLINWVVVFQNTAQSAYQALDVLKNRRFWLVLSDLYTCCTVCITYV